MRVHERSCGSFKLKPLWSPPKSNVVLFYQTYTRYWPKSAELCDFQNRKPGIIGQCTTRVRDFGLAVEISDIQVS